MSTVSEIGAQAWSLETDKEREASFVTLADAIVPDGWRERGEISAYVDLLDNSGDSGRRIAELTIEWVMGNRVEIMAVVHVENTIQPGNEEMGAASLAVLVEDAAEPGTYAVLEREAFLFECDAEPYALKEKIERMGKVCRELAKQRFDGE